MKSELSLSSITAYQLYVSTDERSAGHVKGYYKDYFTAVHDAKNAGWWNSDGDVNTMKLWEDAEGNYYDVKPLGKPVDVEREYKEKIIASVKSKLSDEELHFLSIK